jgi:uncharacterized membrane protein
MIPSQLAAAATGTAAASAFVVKFNDIILFPLIALLSAVALLVFLYGSAEYVLGAANDQAREQGKKHITFGLIGLVIMVAAYGILTLATGTFGLNQQLDCAKDPTLSGCDTAFKL